MTTAAPKPANEAALVGTDADATPSKEPTAAGPVDKRSVRARAMRKKRRAAIMRAATKIFATQGYHEGSIADVIEAAGVSRGTFYLYFDGKREIFDAILSDLLEALTECVVPVDIESSIPPFEQLVANIERVMTLLFENRHRSAILLRYAVGADPGFDHQLGTFYSEVLELIESSLTTGIEIGIVRDIDIKVGALCVLGAVKEVLHDVAIIQPERDVDPRALATSLLDIYLRGLIK